MSDWILDYMVEATITGASMKVIKAMLMKHKLYDPDNADHTLEDRGNEGIYYCCTVSGGMTWSLTLNDVYDARDELVKVLDELGEKHPRMKYETHMQVYIPKWEEVW